MKSKTMSVQYIYEKNTVYNEAVLGSCYSFVMRKENKDTAPTRTI